MGTSRMAITSARARGAETEMIWTTDDPEPMELARSCDAEGAEEYWVGLGGVAGVTISEQTWRLPARLRAGDAYDGSFVTEVLGFAATITRSHRVLTEWVAEEVGLVQLWVGAGEYRTEVTLVGAE